MKKRYPGSFKFKVALEVLKGDRTISDICREHNLTPGLVHKWKSQLKNRGGEVFSGVASSVSNGELEKSKLYEEIGRLKVEVDFLKKIVGS